MKRQPKDNTENSPSSKRPFRGDDTTYTQTTTLDEFEYKVEAMSLQSLPDELILKISKEFLEPEARHYFERTKKDIYEYYKKLKQEELLRNDHKKEEKIPLDFGYYAAKYSSLKMLNDAINNGYQWPTTSKVIKYRITNTIAENGDLELLIWAISNGAPYKNSHLVKNAIKGDSRSILEWTIDKKIVKNKVLDYAARFGKFETLKWLRKEKKYNFTDRTIEKAAIGGHFNIILWAYQKGCKISEYTTDEAAINGHLEILQWAMSKGSEWYEGTASEASGNGHLHILQYALANNCDICHETLEYASIHGHLDIIEFTLANNTDEEWGAEISNLAASNGHLHIINWAWEKGYDLSPNMCERAALNRHYHILTWTEDKRLISKCSTYATTATIAKNGDLFILQWAVEKGFQTSDLILFCAAEGGHLDVFTWAFPRTQLPSLLEEMFLVAIRNGHVEMSQFLHSCFLSPFPYHIVLEIQNKSTEAAADGKLRILEWIEYQLGYAFLNFVDISINAAVNGHLHILKWSKPRIAPIGFDGNWTEKVCDLSATKGHWHVLEWAITNGCTWSKTTCEAAAVAGRLDVLKWATKEHAKDWCEIVGKRAAEKGHMEIIKWMADEGYESDGRNLVKYANENGYDDLAKWIGKYYNLEEVLWEEWFK